MIFETEFPKCMKCDGDRYYDRDIYTQLKKSKILYTHTYTQSMQKFLDGFISIFM